MEKRRIIIEGDLSNEDIAAINQVVVDRYAGKEDKHVNVAIEGMEDSELSEVEEIIAKSMGDIEHITISMKKGKK